jgi:hypothetical protein
MTGCVKYNARRPHQALDTRQPVTPAERFAPASDEQRELLPIWLPGALSAVGEPALNPTVEQAFNADAAPEALEPVAIEFDRVVPPSGNMWVAGRQFWLGPARAGQTVRFWASVDVIHLLIGGARVKILRSHLSGGDLAQLARDGATPAGPPPLPPPERDVIAIEVDRTVNNVATVSLAGRQVTAGEAFRGRRLTIRIESATLVFLDPSTRELLRTRPNPLTGAEVTTLQGTRPAGPPPRPRTEPVTVQRRVSATGVITVCRQRVSLGRVHAGRTVTVHVSEHTLAVELDDETRAIRRTTNRPASSSRPTGRPSPGNVNGTLFQPGTGNGASPTDLDPMNPHDPYET